MPMTATVFSGKESRSFKPEPVNLAIVVPCFNESEVLGITIPKLLSLLEELRAAHYCSSGSFILFVDDGSRDDTWLQIEKAAGQHYGFVRGLRLACNVGHQGALLAGLDYVTDKCDAAVSIDADLQDDLAAIPRMIEEYRAGAEIVLGAKQSRNIDPWLKRSVALSFYKIAKFMGVALVENHADCRLMSRSALKNLGRFSEGNLFLRGLPPLLHRRIAIVRYDITARPAGQSKYPFRKSLALAWNGITSFSVFPLRIVTYVGGLVFVGSFALTINAFVQSLRGMSLPGWASITVPLYMLGGLIMLSVGVVGEYTAKIFLEVKHRPRFLIDAVAGESQIDERKTAERLK